MNDTKVIEGLSRICRFRHTMEDGFCRSISFHDDQECFGSTIRRHPLKCGIVDLVSRMPRLKEINLRKSKLGSVPDFAPLCSVENIR